MEQKQISELHADPDNPRTISESAFKDLQKTIAEYGDLSGIVLNVRTGQLVGGHQRVKLFEMSNPRPTVYINQRLEAPSKVGTVAYGYVILAGEQFNYREVDWPEPKQMAANIAANRVGGEFNKQQLAEQTYKIMQQDPSLLELTGQRKSEIDKLMKSVGVIDDEPKEGEGSQDPADERDEVKFSLTREQKEMIINALDHIRITKDIPSQDDSAMNGSALYYMAQQYMSTAERIVTDVYTPTEVPEV